MSVLSHDDILEIHASALSAGLAGSRVVLLSGIDARFVASLGHEAAPDQQLLVDLSQMDAAGMLADGNVPMARWLANAVALSGARREAAVFRKWLAKFPPATMLAFTAPAQPQVSASSALKHTSVRWLVGQVLRNDSDLDAFCLDYFRAVYDRFTVGMDRVRKVNMLLERASEAEIMARLREHHGEQI